MSQHLRRDLDALKKKLLTMGALVEDASHKALASLVDRRLDLAEEVLEGDWSIDREEVEIEEACLKVLALHQPVAIDLRFIIAVMKVNNDLERMGDLAVNIAERAQSLCAQPAIAIPADFHSMADEVRDIVRDSLDAVVNRDTSLARAVLRHDDEVDELYRRMYGHLQELMREHPETLERGIHLLSASRNLERIADLATNIAEDVIFMVEGEVVRHREAGFDDLEQTDELSKKGAGEG